MTPDASMVVHLREEAARHGRIGLYVHPTRGVVVPSPAPRDEMEAAGYGWVATVTYDGPPGGVDVTA